MYGGVPGVPGTQYLSPFAFVAGGRTGLAWVEGAAKAMLQARHEPSNRPADAPSEGDSEAPPPPPRPPGARGAAASPSPRPPAAPPPRSTHPPGPTRAVPREPRVLRREAAGGLADGSGAGAPLRLPEEGRRASGRRRGQGRHHFSPIISRRLRASRLPRRRIAARPASCFCRGRDLPDSQE